MIPLDTSGLCILFTAYSMVFILNVLYVVINSAKIYFILTICETVLPVKNEECRFVNHFVLTFEQFCI